MNGGRQLSGMEVALCAICRNYPGYTLETAAGLTFGQIDILLRFLELERNGFEQPDKAETIKCSSFEELRAKLMEIEERRKAHGESV